MTGSSNISQVRGHSAHRFSTALRLAERLTIALVFKLSIFDLSFLNFDLSFLNLINILDNMKFYSIHFFKGSALIYASEPLTS
jgi:hypothetical protein